MESGHPISILPDMENDFEEESDPCKQVCDSDMSRHGFAGVCRQLELEASGDVPGGFAGFRGPVAYLAGIGFRCVLDL